MDINLPGMSGIESVRRLRALMPQTQVMMLTVFDDTTSVFESLKAGASGYLLKRAPVGELLTAIRNLAAGGAPMSGVIARKVVQDFGQHGPAPEVQTLTAREHEVLVALSRGEQYKEIAAGARHQHQHRAAAHHGDLRQAARELASRSRRQARAILTVNNGLIVFSCRNQPANRETSPCGWTRGASGFVATHPMKIW